MTIPNHDLGLVHQVHMPTEPAPEQGFPTVVALHGRGSHAGDLLELAPFFGPGWLTVAPQAPFEMHLGWQRGYYWYDVIEVGTPEPQAFERSLQLLRQFIDKLPSAYPVNPKRLYLLGFSMGTVMSYALGLTEPQHYAGLVALSGYIAPQTQKAAAYSRLAGMPILIAHGTYDNVIPVTFGRAARDWLQGLAADVEYHEYPVGHQVSQAILEDIITWLQKRQHQD